MISVASLELAVAAASKKKDRLPESKPTLVPASTRLPLVSRPTPRKVLRLSWKG